MEKIEITKIAKQLIAEAKTDEVFDVLLNFIKSNPEISSDIQNDVIVLASRYNSVKSHSLKGTVSNSELTLETIRLIHSLLLIIDRVSDSLSSQEKEIVIKDDKNILINPKINILGNFHIRNEIKKDEKLVDKLMQSRSKIKILFLASNPSNTAHLRLDKEMREIENALNLSRNRDLFEFIKLTAVRIKDLQESLLNHVPHFVHFAGHGNSDGIALIDNQTDKTQIVPSEPLSNLFKLFSNDISCVFLNSCYSKDQAIYIKRFIPNVIGMKMAIPDNTAIEFATTFYKCIASGKEISFSFEFAKNSIELNNISGSDAPELL
jgi:hypothetical protein